MTDSDKPMDCGHQPSARSERGCEVCRDAAMHALREENDALRQHSVRYVRLIQLLARHEEHRAWLLSDKALALHGDKTSDGLRRDLRLLRSPWLDSSPRTAFDARGGFPPA